MSVARLHLDSAHRLLEATLGLIAAQPWEDQCCLDGFEDSSGWGKRAGDQGDRRPGRQQTWGKRKGQLFVSDGTGAPHGPAVPRWAHWS